MKYVLMLNDMRQANCENLQVVHIGDDPEELRKWYREQRCETWTDDARWRKHFRKESELEWFNPEDELVEGGIINAYWGGIWQAYDNVRIGDGVYKGSI
jgi:hypothetical protein